MTSKNIFCGDRIEWFQGPRRLRRTGIVVSTSPIQARRDSNQELCYVTASAKPAKIEKTGLE